MKLGLENQWQDIRLGLRSHWTLWRQYVYKGSGWILTVLNLSCYLTSIDMTTLAMSQGFVVLKSVRSNFAILDHDGRECVPCRQIYLALMHCKEFGLNLCYNIQFGVSIVAVFNILRHLNVRIYIALTSVPFTHDDAKMPNLAL
jgi:hypothetical protein